MDDPAKNLYPLAINAAGEDATYVGRIREDISCPNGLVMWVGFGQYQKRRGPQRGANS